MGEGATIGHLNVAIHLEMIQMDKNCTISQKNWITGFPLKNKSHFQDFPESFTFFVSRAPCWFHHSAYGQKKQFVSIFQGFVIQK